MFKWAYPSLICLYTEGKFAKSYLDVAIVKFASNKNISHVKTWKISGKMNLVLFHIEQSIVDWCSLFMKGGLIAL